MNQLQLLDTHLGVDRRGFEFLMPEQLLDVADVRSTFEQVRGAGVPEQMAGTGALNAS